MDFKATSKAPTIYRDPTYNRDNTSEMNTSSSSSSYFSSLHFYDDQWTFPPDPRYLRNLNLSELRDVQIFIWNMPAGAFIRESKKGREDFIKSLYTETNPTQATAKRLTYLHQDDGLMGPALEHRHYAKSKNMFCYQP